MQLYNLYMKLLIQNAHIFDPYTERYIQVHCTWIENISS